MSDIGDQIERGSSGPEWEQYRCSLCSSDTPQHDCALVLRAENERLKAERDAWRRVGKCAANYRTGIEVWQQDDPEWVDYWWTELCNALDCKDVGEPPLSVTERMAEHAAEVKRVKALEKVAEAAKGLFHCPPSPHNGWWRELGAALAGLEGE